jgi:hypothetical protein
MKQNTQDKLIADFMNGAHGDDGGPYDTWDKVISVVQKIRGTHYGVANGPQLYRLVELSVLRLDLSEVIGNCIKFINAYNEYRQKHPKLFKP